MSHLKGGISLAGVFKALFPPHVQLFHSAFDFLSLDRTAFSVARRTLVCDGLLVAPLRDVNTERKIVKHLVGLASFRSELMCEMFYGSRFAKLTNVPITSRET